MNTNRKNDARRPWANAHAIRDQHELAMMQLATEAMLAARAKAVRP